MNKTKLFITTLSMVSTLTVVSFAGNWGKDSTGWYYLNDDGTYVTSGWYCIDDDNDGYGKWYRFDENGYMLTNTTVDNRKVNSNGAWYMGDEDNEMASSITQYTPIDESISGIYTYQYNINDSGTWTGYSFLRNSAILEYIDNNHIKVTQIIDYNDGIHDGFIQKPAALIYSRVAGSEFGYVTNSIMDGYMSLFTINPSTNTIIFSGEEDGDSYFVKTDSVKPHEGIVGRYYEEVPNEGTFEVDLYDDSTYFTYHDFISKGRGSSGTYTLDGNKLIFSDGLYYNDEEIYIENGLIYFVEHQTSAIYRGEPDYSGYHAYD